MSFNSNPFLPSHSLLSASLATKTLLNEKFEILYRKKGKTNAKKKKKTDKNIWNRNKYLSRFVIIFKTLFPKKKKKKVSSKYFMQINFLANKQSDKKTQKQNRIECKYVRKLQKYYNNNNR